MAPTLNMALTEVIMSLLSVVGSGKERTKFSASLVASQQIMTETDKLKPGKTRGYRRAGKYQDHQLGEVHVAGSAGSQVAEEGRHFPSNDPPATTGILKPGQH